MSLKESLLELATTYEDIRNESISVINQVKSKVTDLSDIQRMHYLLHTKEFSLKHNLLAVFDLAERHEIKTKRLKDLYTKYKNTENAIMAMSVKLGALGVANIAIGPKALGGICKDGTTVYLHINTAAKAIDVKVHPANEDIGWNQNFEKSAFQMKKDLLNVLDQN